MRKLSFTAMMFAFLSLDISAKDSTLDVPANKRDSKVIYFSDSLELKGLVIRLLKWHENDLQEDLAPKDPIAPDSVYRSIDWEKHRKRLSQLKSTNLFTQYFLDSYDSLAAFLDKELKRNKEKYMVGQLPPYDHANEWCDCQDYPSNPWQKLRIKDLQCDGLVATFSWSWAKSQQYRMRAKKEAGVWKVDWLEKFTVANFKW